MAGTGRQSKGRQKIPITLIANQDDLYATFSKRRLGLYKKASELCTLCGADIGIIIFSPTGNPYSFFHPSMESVIDRYRNPNQQMSDFARIVDSHTRARIENFNKRLDEVLDQKEAIKQREKELDEVDETRQKGWWEETTVETLNKEQVKEWMAWFENLNARTSTRIQELQDGGSGSTSFQQQNAPNMLVAPINHTGGLIGPSTIFGQNYVLPSIPYNNYGPKQGHNYLIFGGGDGCGTEEAGASEYHVPPPSLGDETGDVGPIRFYIPPPSPAHNTFASGGAAGEAAAGPSKFFVPLSSARNPSHNLPTADGTEEAGPSYQGNKNP